MDGFWRGMQGFIAIPFLVNGEGTGRAVLKDGRRGCQQEGRSN